MDVVEEDAAMVRAPPPAPASTVTTVTPIPQDVVAAVPNLGSLTHTTAMCWAAAEGNVEMMRKLREHGADVNAADYDKRALSAGRACVYAYGCTVWAHCIPHALASLPPINDSTPLHIAVSDSQLQAVEYLLQCGAAIEVIDRWGRSPVDCALETKNTTILQLLERAQFNSSSHSKRTVMFSEKIATTPRSSRSLQCRQGLPMLSRSRSSTDLGSFFRAIEEGNTERVKRAWFDGLELDIQDAKGRTSLHIAVENAKVGMIELLLSADVNTSLLDGDGRTPLSIAVEKQYFAIAEMLRNHQKQKVVIQAKDGEDEQHVAQTFRATKRGDLSELKLFVPERVHPDVQDYDLRTLLHIASAEGHYEIVKYLVDCAANVNLLDRWGTSPLSEAIDFAHNKVARFLMANHANESGNRATIAVDQIDNITLNAALEFTLRVVTRKRWLMGQVYCPMTEESGNCVLVAHGVWHRNDSLLSRRALDRTADNGAGDVAMASPPLSPTARSGTGSSSLWMDPIQMFRKVGSLMMIDPGQGHTGSVFSGQHPEWLNLHTVLQSHFFLLPHARRAHIQTIVSVPMIYKMSTIAVLSWYSDEVIAEEPLELQRIQRLLRSVMILSTLRLEVLSAASSPTGTVHVPRFQYCQSLDTALTANGDLIDPSVTSEDVAVGDSFPLALEWGLFDMVDKLATSMSSEDHSAVISLLRSIVALLRNGFFRDALREKEDKKNSPRGLSRHDQTPAEVVAACNGAIRTKRELLVHLKYYLQYLYSVSPTEGTVFMDTNTLVPQYNKYVTGGGSEARQSEQQAKLRPQAPKLEQPVEEKPAPVAVDCVLCKYNVSGTSSNHCHIHPGRLPVAKPPVVKPVVVSPASFKSSSSGDGYFGVPGNPKSPVYREINTLLDKFEAQYDTFSRKASLLNGYWDGNKLATFTSSDLYDAIGAAHETPIRRSTSGGQADPRKRLLEVINEVMQDASCLISYDQLLSIHQCLLPESSGQAGIIRSSAAVGYASPRIYRVFIPVGEIEDALQNLVSTINDTERWKQRPLLCAYYAFAVLVFYIHPFHDGNGRCGRLLCNLIAKKFGFPSLLRAVDKTIEVAEFLQKAVITMETIQNSRRQTRQSRILSAKKENSSMWF